MLAWVLYPAQWHIHVKGVVFTPVILWVCEQNNWKTTAQIISSFRKRMYIINISIFIYCGTSSSKVDGMDKETCCCYWMPHLIWCFHGYVLTTIERGAFAIHFNIKHCGSHVLPLLKHVYLINVEYMSFYVLHTLAACQGRTANKLCRTSCYN